MCGIGAIFTRQPDESIEQTTLAMMRQQRHRGPDLQSAYMAPNRRAALGHARLSIIDLSALANQPMSNEAGDIWLACNGEIYNHRALRSRLEARGHVFRSHSDCETILHLYEEHGVELMDHLHGMYAFFLYDETKDRFLIADPSDQGTTYLRVLTVTKRPPPNPQLVN